MNSADLNGLHGKLVRVSGTRRRPDLKTASLVCGPYFNAQYLALTDVLLGFVVAWVHLYSSDTSTIYSILLACGSIELLAIIAFIGVNWRARGVHVFSIVQGAFAFWYLLPLAAAGARKEVHLGGASYSASSDDLARTLLAVLVAKAFFCLLYATCLHFRLSPSLSIQKSKKALPVPLWLCGAMTLVGSIPVAIGGLNQVLAGREGSLFRHDIMGSAATSYLLLFYFLLSSCPLCLYSAFHIKNKTRAVLYVVLAVFALSLIALIVGARTLLIVMVLPFVSVVMLSGSKSFKKVVFACIVGASLFYLSDVLVADRDYGYLSSFGSASQIEDRTFIDNDFYSELIYCMQVVPSQVQFSFESPLYYVLIGPIPRALWPNKPIAVNTDTVMRMRLGDFAGELTGNILPGILGQYWEVAGWLGISTVGVWLGLFTAFLDSRLETAAPDGVFAILCFAWAGFVSFRYVAASNFVPALGCWLALVLASYLRPVSLTRQRCVALGTIRGTNSALEISN